MGSGSLDTNFREEDICVVAGCGTLYVVGKRNTKVEEESVASRISRSVKTFLENQFPFGYVPVTPFYSHRIKARCKPAFETSDPDAWHY